MEPPCWKEVWVLFRSSGIGTECVPKTDSRRRLWRISGSRRNRDLPLAGASVGATAETRSRIPGAGRTGHQAFLGLKPGDGMRSMATRRTAMHSMIRMMAGGLACALMIVAPLTAQRPERPALNITGYAIDAELDPATHHLAARAVVTFTAPENAEPETAESVSFGFHPALKVTEISDESGAVLTGERSADGAIRITPATPFVRGQAVRWTFEYEGTITGNEDGPVKGLKLAAIQEPISYLLYPARWFPSTGYLTGRFTAEIHIKVPQGMKVFAS